MPSNSSVPPAPSSPPVPSFSSARFIPSAAFVPFRRAAREIAATRLPGRLTPDLISITFKFDVDSRGVVKKYDKSKAGTAFGSFLNDSKLDSYVARTGYDFVGWYTGEKNGEKIGSDTARPSEDTTYYARWQIRTVTIRLGGTVGKNYGYIGIYKGGSFSDNYGVIDNNKGKLSYNYNLLMKNSGELDNNEGLLSLNTGLLHNNRAGAETNKGTIDYNYGVLKVNDETGEVGANSGRDRFCC